MHKKGREMKQQLSGLGGLLLHFAAELPFYHKRSTLQWTVQ